MSFPVSKRQDFSGRDKDGQFPFPSFLWRGKNSFLSVSSAKLTGYKMYFSFPCENVLRVQLQDLTKKTRQLELGAVTFQLPSMLKTFKTISGPNSVEVFSQ